LRVIYLNCFILEEKEGEKGWDNTSMIGLTRERNIGEHMEYNKGTKV
jgi:hypothetical protein